MSSLHAFRIRRSPFPWPKAVGAGLCAGLLAGIGSFTYLYVFDIPYAFRAKKLLFAALGMSASVGLGTLLAPYPPACSLAAGLIGALAVFLFGALRITGPSAIFFVLGFELAAGMPLDPSLAGQRAGLVLLGGGFAWLIGMSGWLYRPHGPEAAAVRKAQEALAAYRMESASSPERERPARLRVVSALRAAEDALASGPVSRRRKRGGADHDDLVRAYESATAEVLAIWEPALRDAGGSRSGAGPTKLPWRTALGGGFDKHSVVLLTAVRFGIVLFVSALVSYGFAFNRSYWNPLCCAAVMSGQTILQTLHRAIQRSLGTFAGIAIAMLVLTVRPEGPLIAAAIFAFTLLTELAIVFNYGLAVLFITPNALLLAESTNPLRNVGYFASARMIDVLVGSAIGLAGALLIGRRQASGLLPHLLAKAIRSEQQLLHRLFSGLGDGAGGTARFAVELRKMRTNLANLQLVYETALGEVPGRRDALTRLQPAVSSALRLGFLLEAFRRSERLPALPDEALGRLLLAFETLVLAAERGFAPPPKPIPDLAGFTGLAGEIRRLQEDVSASAAADG